MWTFEFEKECRNMELRRRDLLRQAKMQMLASEARRNAPALQRQLLALLSDLMISGGSKLQQLAISQKNDPIGESWGEHPEWIANLYR